MDQPLPSADPHTRTASPPDITHTLAGPDGLPTVTAEFSAESHPPMPGLDTRFRLLRRVAGGGMGDVFHAHDSELDRDVAVKVLAEKHLGKPAHHRRFLAEAKLAGQLQHPGLVPVYAAGTLADGRPYFAMKLVRGCTLSDELKARPDPSADLPRFLSVFEQVCQAVGYAHSKGVIHRDLKPDNVMVGAFGEVQVMDWGLAKVLAPLSPGGRGAGGEGDEQDPLPNSDIRLVRTDQTQAGSVFGTPAYMPPEQATGDAANVDRRSDVFGLGGVLCSILTGRPPYTGPDTDAVWRLAARAKLDDALARLDAAAVDAELKALCKRCLSPEPGDRPADAGEVAKAVAAHRAAVEERARQAEIERVRQKEVRKRRELYKTIAGVTFGLLVLSGLAIYMVWTQEDMKEKTRQADEEGRRQKERVERAERVLLRVQEMQKAVAGARANHDLGRGAAFNPAGWKLFLDAAARALEPGFAAYKAVLADARENPEHEATVHRLLLSLNEWKVAIEADEKDRAFAERLGELRLLAAVSGTATDRGPLDDAFLDAFKEYGLDPATVTVAQAAERLKDRPIREAVVDALKDWEMVQTQRYSDDGLKPPEPDRLELRQRQPASRPPANDVRVDDLERRVAELKKTSETPDRPKAPRPMTAEEAKRQLEQLRAGQEQEEADRRREEEERLRERAIREVEARPRNRPLTPEERWEQRERGDWTAADRNSLYEWGVDVRHRLRPFSAGVSGGMVRKQVAGLAALGPLGVAFPPASAELSRPLEELRELAYWYLANNDRASAERVLRRVLALRPDDFRANWELCILILDSAKAQDRERWAEALRLAAAAAAARPLDPIVRSTVSGILMMLERGDEAEEVGRATAAALPDHVAVRVVWCWILIERERLAEATDEVRRLADLAEARLSHPADREAWVSSARAMARQITRRARERGEYRVQVAAAREWVRLDPSPEAWADLGDALDRCHERAEAVTAMRKAVEAAPASMEARQKLVAALNTAGRAGEATRELAGVPEAERGSKWFADADDLARLLDVEVTGLLADYEQGKKSVADMGVMCRLVALYAVSAEHHAAAARLLTDPAVVKQFGPKDPKVNLQLLRATAAAGAGRGVDASRTTADERAAFRRQALGLVNGLVAEFRPLGTLRPDDKERARAVRDLGTLLASADLAGVREEAEMAKLPADEQREWRAVWAEVRALLAEMTAPARTPDRIPRVER